MYLGNQSFATIEDYTFSDNSAPAGGGIALGWQGSGSVAYIYITIIAFSHQGEAIHCDIDCMGRVECCDIYGNAGGDMLASPNRVLVISGIYHKIRFSAGRMLLPATPGILPSPYTRIHHARLEIIPMHIS